MILYAHNACRQPRTSTTKRRESSTAEFVSKLRSGLCSSGLGTNLTLVSYKDLLRILLKRANRLMIMGGKGYHETAYKRCMLPFFNFLKNVESTVSAKGAFFGYTYKRKTDSFYRIIVKRVQSQWRSLLKLDQIRQQCLWKKWDEKVQDLIKRNTGKAKRQQTMVRKLKLISEETRDRAIKKLYMDTKNQYVKTLHKYFRSGAISVPVLKFTR